MLKIDNIILILDIRVFDLLRFSFVNINPLKNTDYVIDPSEYSIVKSYFKQNEYFSRHVLTSLFRHFELINIEEHVDLPHEKIIEYLDKHHEIILNIISNYVGEFFSNRFVNENAEHFKDGSIRIKNGQFETFQHGEWGYQPKLKKHKEQK